MIALLLVFMPNGIKKKFFMVRLTATQLIKKFFMVILAKQL